MAEPRRFYSEFKTRVAALRVDVKDNPVDRPTQVALLPRAADDIVAAATAPAAHYYLRLKHSRLSYGQSVKILIRITL